MSSEFKLVVIHITFWMVLLMTPLAVLFWRLPKGTARVSRRRFFGSIGCGWLLLNLHRWFVELPVLSARFIEKQRADPDYLWDPTSGNVITFLFFWIPVLLVTVVYSLGALLWWRFHKRHG